MKKNLTIYFLCALALLSAGCNKEELNSASVQSEGSDCLVSLNLVGEITTSESELTKGSSTTNNLYAVQVYQNGAKFAWGIFDDVSCMKLNMKNGQSYAICVCMVKDAKSHINYYSLTNGGVDTGNSSGPFYVLSTSYYAQSNVFFYNSNNGYYRYLGASETKKEWYSSSSYSNNQYFSGTFTQIRQGKLNNTSYPTCTDWFYGEGDFTPDGEFGTMDISLKRTGFKLKYELSGVTDGSVTVKIYNGTRTFIENTTTTASYASDTQFIAFYDTYSAWQYADNYTENLTVAVTWVRGIGITQNLGTKTVQVKRNCLNNIKIKLGSDDRGAGVNLSTESESSMGSADNDIPVQ